NLSPAGTPPWHAPQTFIEAVGAALIGVGAALIGVTVAEATASAGRSSPPVAFFNSRRPSPAAFPRSANFPGPTIRRRINRMTIKGPGCSAPSPIRYRASAFLRVYEWHYIMPLSHSPAL